MHKLLINPRFLTITALPPCTQGTGTGANLDWQPLWVVALGVLHQEQQQQGPPGPATPLLQLQAVMQQQLQAPSTGRGSGGNAAGYSSDTSISSSSTNASSSSAHSVTYEWVVLATGPPMVPTASGCAYNEVPAAAAPPTPAAPAAPSPAAAAAAAAGEGSSGVNGSGGSSSSPPNGSRGSPGDSGSTTASNISSGAGKPDLTTTGGRLQATLDEAAASVRRAGRRVADGVKQVWPSVRGCAQAPYHQAHDAAQALMQAVTCG